MIKRISPAWLLLGGLVLSSLLAQTGCQQDDIRTYSVPRLEDQQSGPVRLLAAMIVSGDDTWFVKVVGRNDILEAVQPVFDQLLASMTFNEKGSPSLSWKIPAGWKEDRTNPARVATLTPEGVGKPEITISKLARAAAVLKPNIDRWRKLDLGLGPITARDLAKVASKRKVGDKEIDVIDMRGPGSAQAAPKMPPLRPAKEKSPLQYDVPAGWEDLGSTGIAVATLSVKDGGQSARVLVTPLRGSMPGGLLANINRWRGEVGLSSITEAELPKQDIRTVRVGKVEARLIESRSNEKASYVVWAEKGGTTWFIKMIGPIDLMSRQKDNFEKFVRSLNLTGAADE